MPPFNNRLPERSAFQPTAMTMDSANYLLDDGLAQVGAGRCQVDLSCLSQFDSTALALLLAWRRAALARNQRFIVSHMPSELRNLACAYGVDSLLVENGR